MTRAEQRAHAANAILNLVPTDDREVLKRRLGLHDGHPRTHKAVADELGMTVAAVKAAEARSLQVLRQHVDPDDARELLAA